MKAKDKIKLAIAYDFDGTLAPGNMQEHSFIPKLGIDKMDFWQEANTYARKHDMDDILAYMQLMLQKANNKNIPITRSSFLEHGKEIVFFKGVETFFNRINAYAAQYNTYIEHYIISSGVRDIVKGTPIAHHFKSIFASGYVFDNNDIAIWPALAINYTNKTQYLFRINKGIYNSWDNTKINKYLKQDEKPMPFSKMVYIGDGLTDVPAMKMIKHQGGTAIAVYDPDEAEKPGVFSAKNVCEELIEQNRADYIAPADYTENSDLDKLIKTLINKIVQEEILRRIGR
ncbi:MAG: haloacid dehalogenase-like hydrolase [Bacteroidales bacterium]|nr:haloacid dehalogenase-like hydrolase [Bacteroidales bacterium]MCF8388134.1 haloacid dehalogenase-like hydrolase [Bacteroidales bacterium]MCF8398886.1 haloacid dehalogenase-like hydrolase [Bacteroidales bacterium]